MKLNFASFRLPVLLALCWLASSTLAQAQSGGGGGGGGGARTGGGTTSSGTRSASGSSSGSSGASTREYPNNTLPGDATISIDPTTHSLVIMTDDETFANISTVVSNLDRPKPQVLIKVVFVEVQHDNDLDIGIEGSYNHNLQPYTIVTNVQGGNNFGLANLGNTGQTIGQSTMPTGAGIYSVLGNDFSATIRAIASATKTEVLSRPSILVGNNQPATITVGQSIPIITGYQAATTASPVQPLITYTQVGIILQVTPFISKDGMVEMIVSPSISALSSTTVQIASNINSPVIDLRSASTVVVTPDGQTVIIGGLMENDKTFIDSKIPFLGDIPYLGYLFKHHQEAITKKELLIFLTPYVVKLPTQLAGMTEHETSKAEVSRQSFKEKELDKFFDTLPIKPMTNTVTIKKN